MNSPAAPITPPRRSWLHPGSIWLALLIVLGNALDPVGPALEARSGSAFNAFTSDVSLGPVREQGPAKARSSATGRDRHFRYSGGGDVALLPHVPARTVVATLDPPPAATMPPGLPVQSAPGPYQVRAPPRA